MNNHFVKIGVRLSANITSPSDRNCTNFLAEDKYRKFTLDQRMNMKLLK